MQKKQLITRKPAYYTGQLLLEEDFIAEQAYHAEGRYQHVRTLHGFGVVHGLKVTRSGDLTIGVSPGYGVDRHGHEIELRDADTLTLHGVPPGSLAWVTLGYRTERPDTWTEKDKRIDCYAFLQISTGVERSAIRLARVQVDVQGRVGHIDHAERDELRTGLAPGSVTPETLAPHLRDDWMTMPFHPVGVPRGAAEPAPPFRVGVTQAEAHTQIDGKPNLRGAAGTMAIILPMGVRYIHEFRVAGASNERKMVTAQVPLWRAQVAFQKGGCRRICDRQRRIFGFRSPTGAVSSAYLGSYKKMTVKLLKGGFDPINRRHVRDDLVVIDIPSGAYCETVEIPEAHRGMADRYRTLSVEIRADGFAAVSLIALRVSM